MTTSITRQTNDYRLALLFRQFMLINNRFSFSSVEIKDIGIQLTRILGIKSIYSVQRLVLLLQQYGIKGVYNKHSHSFRSRLWFHKSLDPLTLKVAINV